MNAVVDERHRQAAGHVRELLAAYEQKRDLIALGAYKRGSDDRTDEAIAAMDAINAFLRQGTHENTSFAETRKRLFALV
jgi:flagellar biosynthesis/type III secretory pathway ATPase